jgi:uncharacterized protein (TIRG00374 family)
MFEGDSLNGPDTPVASRSAARRWLIRALKVAVTVGLLGFLFSRLDLRHCARILAEAEPLWLVSAFLAAFLMLLTSSLKWNRLLRVVGIELPRRSVLEIYTIGFFASRFLPGQVGGDVVRWQLMGNHPGSRFDVAATIIVERATGLVALLLLCLFIVLIGEPRFATTPVVVLVTGMTGASALALAAALNRRLVTGLKYRLRRSHFAAPARLAYRLHATLRAFSPAALAVALVYSFLFYASGALTLLLSCVALGGSLGFGEALAVQSLVSLLIMLPITLGGLGLAQVGDVYLLEILGTAPERGLMISLVRQLISYGYVIIGGLLFIRWRNLPSRRGEAPSPVQTPEQER